MSDTSSPFGFNFFQNDPNVNMQLRQRIALAMLSRSKRAPPKNFGEGLYSAGEDIADALTTRGIQRDDLASQSAAVNEGRDMAARVAATSSGVDPAAAAPPPSPPPPAATRSFVAEPPPPPAPPQPSGYGSQLAPPPGLTTAPQQPDAALSPQAMAMPPGGAPPAAVPPQMQASLLSPAPALPPQQRMPPPGEIEPGVVGNDVNLPPDPWAARSRAIAGIESGGSKDPYSLMGAPTRTGDRAIGKYQVMGANVPEWTEAALGRPMTPEQFRNDSAAQEAVFQHRFGQYVDKYGEEGAARAWFGGERGMNNPGATDIHGRLTVGTYGQDYLRRLGAGSGNMVADAVAARNAEGGGSSALAPPDAPAPAPALPRAITGGPPPAPASSRDSIANTMVAQAQPRPSAPPAAAPPPGGDAAEAPRPGYIMKAPTEIAPRRLVEPTALERELAAKVAQATAAGNTYRAGQLQPLLQDLQRKREFQQSVIDKENERTSTLNKEMTLRREDQRVGAAKSVTDFDTAKLDQEKRRMELEDAKEKSTLQSRFGGRDPEQVFKAFDADKESAKKATHALAQFSNARDMIKNGVIVGTAQGWKVNAAKVASMFGSEDAASHIARTEQMQAAIKSTLSIAIENIQGAGGKVSDTDVRIAEGTIGADPNLQLQTITNLVNRGEAAARGKLNDYEDQVHTYLGGTKAEKRYQVPLPESAPEDKVQILLEKKDSKAYRDAFDEAYGPGAAKLEISRAKRREEAASGRNR